MKMNKRVIVPLMIIVLASSMYSVISVKAACPYAGLTPGFWKNRGLREDLWPSPYDPTDPLSDYFVDGPAGIDTLLDALRAKGGDDVEGAKRILARAAVAALLNYAYFELPGVYGQYKYTDTEIIGLVNSAFASEDRDTMISLAEELDEQNNMGVPTPP